MPSVINLQLGESTATHPFNFFDRFYREGVLQRVRANFFDAYRPQTGFEHTYGYLFYPYEDQDYFKIEFPKEDYDPENPMETYQSWQEVKTFTFREELFAFLRDKYLLSMDLMAKRMSSSIKVDNLRRTIKNELIKIEHHVNFIDQDNFAKTYSSECKRPLIAFVKELSKLYPEFVPSAKGIIKSILDGSTPPIDCTPSQLKLSLADGIINFSNSNDDLFFFDSIDPADKDNLKTALLNFITGDFEKITSPINFTKNIEAVQYLISLIVGTMKFSLKKIEASKIITLRNKNFTANACYKGKSVFLEKNHNKRIEIDLLLKEHSE